MKRHIIRIAAVLVILAGAGLLFYPLGSRYLGEQGSRNAIRRFQEEAAAAEEEPSEGGDADSGSKDVFGESGQKDSRLDRLLADLQAYNEEIYADGQAGLQDPFDYETPSFDLTGYGFSENVIGTLWIPRMDVELPIYLGANKESMSKGAALLGQTSMPLGGENTNTVLAAHRGYRGIPMFRNIQKLQIGDKIQITTPWDTLIYRVCELKIVSPEDSSQIYIQPGRDLVTLITCHPYTKNYQRYLVFAERQEEETRSREADLAEAENSYTEAPRQVEEIGENGESSITWVSPEDIRPAWSEGISGMEYDGAGYSNLQIWLEDHVTAISLGLIALAVLALALRRRRKNSG